MQDTIYSLFTCAVKAHTNEPAIIENNRTLTFGELSDLVDMIAGSFPKEVSKTTNTNIPTLTKAISIS